MKANNVEELFGTLQQSVVEEWRKHLKTSKYSKHMALDEFYKEMPDLIDDLIEHYMAAHGKVENYKNILKAEELDALQYLEALKEICTEGREDLLKDESELKSDMDAILAQIDSTIYKVRELKEHKMKSLRNYLNENISRNIINESKDYVIYVPVEGPEDIEGLDAKFEKEFGKGKYTIKTDEYSMGDPEIKVAVTTNNSSRVKAFASELSAKCEEA